MKIPLLLLTVATLTVAQERAPYKTPWELLKAEYDKDGDGRVTTAEYTRGEERFKRLDRNADGTITETDFAEEESSGGSGAGRPRGARRRPARNANVPTPAGRAGRILAQLLAADDAITKDAVTRWFTGLDADGDRLLADGEITCVTPAWRQRAIEAFDKNRDDRLDHDELKRAFALADTDGSGVLDRQEMGKGRTATVAPAAPAVGEMAPDFTLKALDGKSLVTLSSFRKNKPVALIFGSYT